LVRESAQFVDGEARQHGIHVQLNLAPSPLTVMCNGVQIEQVMLNLLRNAVEAVQGHADPRVAIITAPAGRDGVEVSVRDNGVGLPEPSADVFAPFYSTKEQGLGMGLSISSSIIEAHQGQLCAMRNANGGATFCFTLPLGSVPGPEGWSGAE